MSSLRGVQVEQLSDVERDILAFEKKTFVHQGSKEDAIRTLFDMSPTRYYQMLVALIRKPAALVAEPQVVRRWERILEQRRGVHRRRSG